MSVIGTRLLGSLQAVLKTVSQRPRRPGESWLTQAMAIQLARARKALAEDRAQDVVDDIGASLDPQVVLLAATAATIGLAYDQLGRGSDRDQAFKLAVKLFGMASAEPGPAEALAIVPALEARGKRAQAIGALRAVAAAHPADVPVARLLADELEQAGDPGTAAAYADVARLLGPGDAAERVTCLRKAVDPGSVSAQRARAQLLERLGRYPEAIAACDAILALAPDDGAALLTRGMARYAQRELDEAAEDLCRAAELAEKAADAPLRATALAWQGETLRMRRRYDEALGLLDQAVEAGPPSAFTLGTRGQVLTALGRHAEAIEALTAASLAHPCPPWVHAALADVHRLDQRWAQALAELDMATIEGETAYTHFVRGLVLAGLEKTGEAADELRTAWIMQRSPEIAEELTRVLGVLGGKPELEESLAVMDETIAAQTATRPLLARRAETLRTLGRPAEALAAVDLLLADGEDSRLLGLRALVLADLGRAAEARDLADAVLARDQGNIFARCARIEACMADTEYEDALAAAEALLKDVPGYPLGTLLKGVILCNIARYRDTVETLAPMLGDDSGQPLAHGLAGYALRRQDPAQPWQASTRLRRAVALDPAERWYQIELADTLYQLDDREEACRISQEVLDNAPAGSQVTARKLGYADWAALLLNRPDDAVTLVRTWDTVLAAYAAEVSRRNQPRSTP